MQGRAIAAGLSLVLLAGCAGQNVRLSEAHRKTLTTEPVHAVHLAPTGFLIESTGNTVVGILMPLAAIPQAMEAASLSSGLGLQDPAPRVKERLLAALEESYRLPNVVRVAQPAPRFAADNYQSLSGVVLEVRTTKWGIDNNRAKYAAGARVIRVADGQTLWDAVCNDALVDRDKPGPSIEALRADNGALLKAKLTQAADACSDQLSAWILERVEKR